MLSVEGYQLRIAKKALLLNIIIILSDIAFLIIKNLKPPHKSYYINDAIHIKHRCFWRDWDVIVKIE